MCFCDGIEFCRMSMAHLLDMVGSAHSAKLLHDQSVLIFILTTRCDFAIS